ncbi:hypothetical protein ACIP88_27570 [Streptomyces uncialis]|uniref:hypothetical protein n=1 Tax=Streptomyces uncialis TaxID=1048205 RepID=UPI003804A53E
MAEDRYSPTLKVTGKVTDKAVDKVTGKVTDKAVDKVTRKVTGKVTRKAVGKVPARSPAWSSAVAPGTFRRYPPVPLAGVTGRRDSRTGPDGGEFTGATPGISLSRPVRGAGAVAGPECVRNPG